MILEFPGADPELRAIGARLRSLRTDRGVSVQALARRLGLADAELALAERGRRRLTSVQLYAATLHLSVPMRLLFEDGGRIRPFRTEHFPMASPPPNDGDPPHDPR